jgi:hypothetical protein
MSNQNFKRQISTWVMFRIIELELQNVIYFKHFSLEIYFNSIFLIGIMFAYTTSDVYLTIRFKY